MNIQAYKSNMVGHLVTTYNQAVKSIPHCYRVDRQAFLSELQAAECGEESDSRHDEAVFVAVDERKLAGFIHAAIGPVRPKADPTDEGLIRFFWYQPGNREAGAALLQAAEEHCSAHGMTAVNVFHQNHRYSFHQMEAAYMSDRLGHVAAILGMGGYKQSAGEVFMDWPDYSMDEPAPLSDSLPVDIERTSGLGRHQGVTLRIQPHGKLIAICENVSAGEFSHDRLAQEWLLTHWLWVDEEYRGLGLGRYLLQRALWEAQDIGYRHAAISTAWDNHRALLFYTNFGYEIVDWTHGYRRELT